MAGGQIGSMVSSVRDCSSMVFGDATTRFISLLLISWLAWRVWRFTITPLLFPGSPKELPYWIPIVGHGVSFFKSTDALLAKASNYFGTKEPFSLTVFGNTLYIVTEPQNTTEVYKSDDTLSFEMFVQDLFRSNGYSKEGLEATYARLPKDKPGFPNPRGVSFGSFVNQMHMHQLYPGENLSLLEDNFRVYFNQNLSLSLLQRACSRYATITADGSVELPLERWCSEISIRAGEFAYFGDALSRVNPNLANDFLVFDELGWQVLYQYPGFLSRKMSTARSQIQRTFKQYLQIPQSQRTAGGAVWLINAMEDEARALGVSEDDIAVLLFNIYWVISTNTRKIAFWLTSNLLHTPSLLNTLREETAAAFRDDELVDPAHLWAHCPVLDSVWNETLRLCSNAASVRRVDRDTVIGGKELRAGNRIMIPYRLLHFDARVYGADARDFRPQRFLEAMDDNNNNNKRKKGGGDLTRGPSWRPFGGGKTLCTGRHAAKRATLLFAALLLRRFDVAVVGCPRPPRADLGRPVLGISSVREGDDFTVSLSPRKLG
ncbi:putative cytochrome p450 [Xylariomycetidae sp. FL0641]|nr:putative cytochrome p450 [Xylariomycetidae sp. FL0641]